MSWSILLITGVILALIQAEINRYIFVPLNLTLIFLFLISIDSARNFAFWAFWFSVISIVFEGWVGLWLAIFIWLSLFIYELFKKKLSLGLLPLLGIWLVTTAFTFLPVGLFFLKNVTLFLESILLTFSLGGLLILILKLLKKPSMVS